MDPRIVEFSFSTALFTMIVRGSKKYELVGNMRVAMTRAEGHSQELQVLGCPMDYDYNPYYK